jgi:hypothetical protein
LDLPKLLNEQSFLKKEILLGKKTQLQVRIICHKLTDEQSMSRRRKANLLAKGHGYKSSAKNQALLNWSIFITNIPENKVNSEYIWAIYRARWQIELLFKLYKSHLEIETLKGKSNSSRILCELYAKLCSICIFHGLTSCLELERDNEISLTKALIEFKKRVRELFLVLNRSLDHLQNFLQKLILSWSKFCLKDKYRKQRISTLDMLKSLVVVEIKDSMAP